MEPKQQLTDLQQTLINISAKVGTFFRHHKKLSYILIGVVCLIIAAYIAGSSLLNPQDKILSFQRAVQSGDVGTLKSLLSSEESTMTIDDKHLKQLIAFSKDHNGYLSKQVDGMLAQLNDNDSNISTTNGNNDFYLKKTNIPLFYSYYSIEVRPYFIDLSTDQAGATIKLDGKQVLKTTSSEQQHTVGPLMPGIYKAYAEKQYPYSLLSQAETVTAFDQDNGSAEADLSLSGSSLQLEGNFPDISIYINGKGIGKTLKQLPEINPISENGTIRIHGERQFPWGLEKSPDVVIDSDTSSVDITPVPFSNPNARQTIVNLINKFAKEEMQALIKHDPNQFTTIDDNLKNGYIKSINDDAQAGYTTKGQVLDTRIDFDNITLSQDENTGIYTAVVPVDIHEKFKDYDPLGFNKDQPLDDKVNQDLLTLSYDEKNKRWLVSSEDNQIFGSSDYFNGQNIVKSVFQ